MDHETIHYLGKRAFSLFLLHRIKLVLGLSALTWLAWYAKDRSPAEYLIWVEYVAQLLLLLSIAWFVYIFIRTYLEYRRYTYQFKEEAFMLTDGYFVRNETAVAYHHIQSVNIRRTPLDRIFGVSQLVILLIGSDHTHQPKVTLPGIGKRKARLVQQELLVRARRQLAHPAPPPATD